MSEVGPDKLLKFTPAAKSAASMDNLHLASIVS